MAVQWTQDLAVGVAEIDAQHQELFRRVDLLLTACAAGKGKAEAERMLAYLEQYTVEHFSAEEAVMFRIAYPSRDAHRSMHRKFVDKMGELKRELAERGPSSLLVTQINRAVVDWLVNHIGKADREIGEFIRANPSTSAHVGAKRP